jgi:hypothetical protein
MVHALQEVRRVLKPGGIVIDLRPICVAVPLFILTSTGWISAGIADRGPERVDDVAANRAMRIVVRDGSFKKLRLEYFNLNYYWNDLKELKMDLEGRWKGDIVISREIWQHARRLFKNGSGQDRIWIPIRMKIARYQKL